MNALELDGVSFSYPDGPAPALADVTLAVARGSFALVTGPTGSGKSTLLRTINGLVPHFSGGSFTGRVTVDGRDTLEHAPRDLSDVVAFVPQDPSASFVVDVVDDELAYAMENLGVERSAMRRRVEEVLDLLNLESLRDRSVRTLSGGERQRVAIAAALTAGPRVLVLDEPTSQLDPQGAEDVLAALQRLVHDLGLTVVLAEHRLERVAGFADVAIACDRGRVRTGDPRELLLVAGEGPPVARLGELLGWRPLPLTVREARRHQIELGRPPDRPAVDRDAPNHPTGDREAPHHPMLSATALGAAYGDRRVLRAIDLALYAGEIVALVGRNGAGKTTLLRCLAGLHQASSGAVTFAGRAPVAGRDVAYCPHRADSILFKDDVLAELQATVEWSGSEVSSAAVLDELGLSHLGRSHPRDLSGGERVLVAIGAIAATGAPVLLLDEPTRGLDPRAKRKLIAFLRARADGGNAVVVATHDVELAAAVATRVVMLAGGEVIASGSPEDVLGDSSVFAPQVARVLGPEWLTVEHVARALEVSA